jgi:hypothetical protein
MASQVRFIIGTFSYVTSIGEQESALHSIYVQQPNAMPLSRYSKSDDQKA